MVTLGVGNMYDLRPYRRLFIQMHPDLISDFDHLSEKLIKKGPDPMFTGPVRASDGYTSSELVVFRIVLKLAIEFNE
jgi:hypothetical protein